MSEIIYSQNEEQTIIKKLLDKYNIKNMAVEIGINTGAKGNGKTLQGNTVSLRDSGWNCVWIDGRTQHHDVLHRMVYPENIQSILDEHVGHKQIGIFSIDIDSEDWHVVRKILEGGRKPEVMLCETNAYIDPMHDMVMPLGHRRSGRSKSRCHGASLTAFNNLLSLYGYSYFYTTGFGTNSFWIRSDLEPKSRAITEFKDRVNPVRTNWSRTNGTDVWTTSKDLLA